MERPNVKDFHSIGEYCDALEDYIDHVENLNRELLDIGWRELENSGLDRKLKKW